MRVRPFLAGLAAGLLVAAIPAWLLRPRHNAWLSQSTTPGVGGDGEVRGDGDLTAENARLREQLDALRDQLARRPVDADANGDGGVAAVEAAAGSAADGDGSTPPADLPALLAELDLQLNSGVLAQRYASDPVQLRAFLVQNWLAVGRPTEALALLRGLEPPNDALGYAQTIGDALRKRGDPALAAQAYLLALRASPTDWNIVQRVLEFAPGAALAQLQAMDSAAELGVEARAQRALLRMASGDSEAGLAEIDALLETDQAPLNLFYHLVEQDPAAAEARLRARLAATADNAPWLEARLADALQRQGRTADAVAQVESMLERRPEELDAVRQLGEFDRAKALGYLEARISASRSQELYGAYAQQLLAAGRREDAVDAYWQAWEISGNTNWAGQLLKLAPDRVATPLIQRAGITNDDELFGDIADALWRAGQRDRARSLWERAHQIDRNDSEWTNKLAKVARGADPFS